MVIYNPLTRSAAIVAVFWWLVGTIAAVVYYPSIFTSAAGLSAAARYTTVGLAGCAIGAIFGAAFVLVQKILQRIATDRDLAGAGRLGMLCTLGNMPVETGQALDVAGAIPDWFFDPAVVTHGPALRDWITSHQPAHPEHVAALIACIKVLCQFPKLPASHVPNGHGGKSLVDHSARVASLAITEARSFRYAGLVTKYGNEPWGDPGYDFDPQDPLIPLIGFAHDIGKLATFITDDDFNVVGTRPNHDAIGSRLLATMDSIKALPAHDQAVLHRAISFYHHPSAYPMNSEGRIGDDRSVALMMLLIKADKRAGKEEAGQSLTPEQYAAYLRYMQDLGQELDADETKTLEGAPAASGAVRTGKVVTDAQMTEAMLKILLDPVQVLTVNPKGKEFANSVGQVVNTTYPEWAWDWIRSGEPMEPDAQNRLSASIERLVVLHESKFRLALAKRLGLGDLPKKGDGRYLLTIHALTVLHKMGVLYTDGEAGFISPESALYVAKFVRRTDGSDITEWRGAIILRPGGPLDKYKTGPVHPSFVDIIRPLWKDRVAQGSATASATDASGDDQQPGAGPIDEGAEYAADEDGLLNENADAQMMEQPAEGEAEDFELVAPDPNAEPLDELSGSRSVGQGDDAADLHDQSSAPSDNTAQMTIEEEPQDLSQKPDLAMANLMSGPPPKPIGKSSGERPRPRSSMSRFKQEFAKVASKAQDESGSAK